MTNLFSVPIFVILFRESLEASIIVSVLLGLVEQIVKAPDKHVGSTTLAGTLVDSTEKQASADSDHTLVDPQVLQRRLWRKLRIQIFGGAFVGLFIALCIGAAFLAVYYTTLDDLYAASEDLWEGIFSLVAALMIFVMSLAMLKMDRAKAKWRVKLAAAFHERPAKYDDGHHGGRAEKYALFILPAITVLREGLEAVVFVGGVSLGQPGGSIPIAAVVGLFCGLAVGVMLYFGSRRINLSYFLVFSTSFLLLVGAGLMSKAVGDFQNYSYNKLAGADVAETGSGPGSYDVHGNVWHLDCCNPEIATSGEGWSIFNAILGWTNNATIGTILSYVLYWLAAIVVLVWMKWNEGRVVILGKESTHGQRRRERREASTTLPSIQKQGSGSEVSSEGDQIATLPKDAGAQPEAHTPQDEDEKGANAIQ